MVKKLLSGALAALLVLTSAAQAADIQSWSTTAGSNVLSSGTAGTGGVNTDEGMAPDLVNNAMRDMMARIASWRTGGTASAGFWGSLTIGHTAQLAVLAVTPPFQIIGALATPPRMAMDGFGSNGQLIFYRSANTTIGSATVVASGDILGEIKWAGAQQTGTFSNSTQAASITASVDNTVTSGASADMPGRLVFSTSADSSGTPTERMRITSTGLVDLSQGTFLGFKFPATDIASANANTLDDYEEGTWTPVLIGLSTAGTGTYTNQTGTYTKIGRMVYFDMTLAWTAHTGTGNMQVNGLPFTALSDAMITCLADNMTFSNGWGPGYIISSTTTLRPTTVSTGAAFGLVAMDTSATLRCSGTYAQ